MRQILVDFARLRRSAKRAHGLRPAALEEALVVTPQQSTSLVALDDALKSLARVDARKSQVVEMRFFGGLTEEETAEVLKISEKTVRRDWNLAKVWLMRELSGSGEHGG
jgi:RNA polymerase sigma factor (TIGR02999 family)